MVGRRTFSALTLEGSVAAGGGCAVLAWSSISAVSDGPVAVPKLCSQPGAEHCTGSGAIAEICWSHRLINPDHK